MEEIWKPIVGYEGLYEISSLGRVKSLHNLQRKRTNERVKIKPRPKEKILKPTVSTHGYIMYHLTKNNSIFNASGHRIIAQAFIPNPLNKPQVNHIDNNRLNNNISNLEWVTALENTHHCIKQKRNMFGEKHYLSKLTNSIIFSIRKSKEKNVTLSKLYGVHQSNISRIKSGEYWKL